MEPLTVQILSLSVAGVSPSAEMSTAAPVASQISRKVRPSGPVTTGTASTGSKARHGTGKFITPETGAGAAAAAAAGEEIYAIGDRLALRWAAGLDSAGHVQQGRYFTAGYFRGGQAPSLGYEAACDRAQLKPGANLLAYLFGRDRDIRGGEHELPDGMDLERLEYSLKNDGYQIDSAPGLWDEEHFLYRFAESCEAGEAAVRLMIQQGASPEMMEDAVAYAVEIGDLETLGKLKAAGCSVSDDQLAECRRQADDEE
mmetsp:Transcript_80498/g.209236  ORF Transcript_80498/g.209236 Transcript_80498/m.209236 type:complete len:257 (+) Transcript_80498:1338-2108(+)